MAQRRPIASHPAFVPLLALWFAALFGLAVAVLPGPLLEGALSGAGLTSAMGRVVVSVAAALGGLLVGLALAVPMARRSRSDPRPIYSEPEPSLDHPAADEPVRRPLRVREELEHTAESLPDEALVLDHDKPAMPVDSPAIAAPTIAGGEEGFMILTPQPIHPPRPAPDLEGLLEQFDHALDAFQADEDGTPSTAAVCDPDPVHAFVARQTGTPAPSPLGGRMPDHQAELRAVLDKLARAQREDD